MNFTYSLPCFSFNFNDMLNTFSCLVGTWFQYVYINSKETGSFSSSPIKNLLTFASGSLVKVCNFYLHLSLETVFPTLKLTQIGCINMKLPFLENSQFNHKLAPLLHISSSKYCNSQSDKK